MAGEKYLTRTSVIEPGENALRFVFAYLALFMALTLVWGLLLSSPALAFSPHGGFSSETDKCSMCHRMHSNQADKLLPLASTNDFCYSCHAKGQGADSAVREGVYYDGQNNGHGWGVTNGNLLGGGFEYTSQVNRTTGNHHLGATDSAYGGNPGSPAYTLSCIDCHTPHQGPNYRLLRQSPGGTATQISVPWNGPWTDDSQTVRGGDYKAFTEHDFTATDGVTEYTRNYAANIAAWCTACHTRYYATNTNGTANIYKAGDVYNAGDTYGTIARHRHTVNTTITGNTSITGYDYNLKSNLPLEDVTGNGRTADDRLTCLSCHKAHGSSATMYGSAILEDRGPLPSGTDSMMLRTDARAMCGDCHNIGTHN
jgi:predicted CXXCH cytochrome family protein